PDNRLSSTSLDFTSVVDAQFGFSERLIQGRTANLGIWRLGDLNQDGYDDFGVSLEVEYEGADQGSLYIYYGSARYAAGSLPDGLNAADADVVVARQRPGQLTGGLGLAGLPTVTAGDFNGDGRPDLALGDPFIGLVGPGSQYLSNTRGQAAVFYSVAGRGRMIHVDEADLTLRGQQEIDLFGTLPTRPNLDLNRDGVDDLAVGAPFASVLGDP